MANETITDTLSKLYSLRAGLSIIADEKDSYYCIEREADNKIKGYTFEQKNIERKQKELHKLIKENRELLKDNQAAVGKKRLSSKSIAWSLIWPILLCLIGIGAVIGIAIGISTFLTNDYNASSQTLGAKIVYYLFQTVTVVAALAAGIAAIVFTVKYVIENVELTKFRKKEQDEAINIVDSVPVKIKRYEDEIKSCESRALEIPPVVKSINEQKLVDVMPHYITGNAVYKALQKEYSEFLDERDWINIDLIIYAYETKRADSLKDALRYVDEERRTDKIVKAIENSTSQICRTIELGMQNLAVSMVKCFQVLSDQIEINAQRQAEQLKILTANIEGLGGKIDYVAALNKYSRVSSNRLYDENKVFLSQAKALMDNRMVQMRNNGGF